MISQYPMSRVDELLPIKQPQSSLSDPRFHNLLLYDFGAQVTLATISPSRILLIFCRKISKKSNFHKLIIIF